MVRQGSKLLLGKKKYQNFYLILAGKKSFDSKAVTWKVVPSSPVLPGSASHLLATNAYEV